MQLCAVPFAPFVQGNGQLCSAAIKISGDAIMVRCSRLLICLVPVVIVLGLYSPESWCHGLRHHEAHVHGVARMNVALEGDALFIELISPAANIVGFEHAPRNAEQKAALRNALETLRAGMDLFTPSADAGARLVEAKVESDISDDDKHPPEVGHNHGHNHDPGPGHKLASQSPNQHGHSPAEDHDHDHHSDFRVQYHFVLQHPEKLTHVDVMAFRIFPGIEHIEVQLLTGAKQTALKLSPQNNRIAF
jgi:hypothetical protein